MTAPKPPKTPPSRNADAERRARQAEALRANLRRRKAAARDDDEKPAGAAARDREG